METRLIDESFEFDAHATLMSDTLSSNGRVGTGTRTGVWLYNKPTDLSACVIEKRGHGEGGVPYATDTLYQIHCSQTVASDTL